MAEADPDAPMADESSAPADPRGRSRWARGMACVAILPLLGFIGQSGRSLWGEWGSLREEKVAERASIVVGYINITPNPSYAEPPADWFHHEGEDTLLWSGWVDGRNRWFRVGRGDLEARSLSMPIGKDVVQAIDAPLYEQAGGACWGRIPDDAAVIGLEGLGASVAYPLRVLAKVEVVNERVGDRPILVTCDPFSQAVSIYEGKLDGRRMTMGLSGYLLRDRPVLYDRGTDSLWTERGGELVAVAGRRKGTRLSPIARPEPAAWGDWRSAHPGSRLLVGADRSQPRPAE